MAYYSEEKPLPKCDAELYVIVSAVSAADKAAVRKVADRFFPVGDDGQRRNGRADAEIEKAQRRINVARENGSKGGRKPNPAGNPLGIPVGNPAGIPPETQRATQRLTHSGEALHTPHATYSVGGTEASTEDLARPTAAGRACLAMRAAGCVQTNPSHPELLAAIADGVTPEALADTVREGLSRSPPVSRPFAWAIATARSRHAAAAQTHPGDHHAVSTPRRKLSAVEQVEAAIRDRRAREADGQPPAAA